VKVLTGMMRQLGGSLVLPLITTFITRFSQEHRVNLAAHLDEEFEVQQRLLLLQKDLCLKDLLMKKAYQAIDYSVMKQSTVLSYMDIFLYLESCFCYIFFIKKGQNKFNPADAALLIKKCRYQQ
jgi:DHA2 family multidrug resistance protein